MRQANGASETASSQGGTPYDIASDANALSLAGDAEVLAQHPDLSCSVIDLEGTLSHKAETFGHRSSECDLFVGITARIVIDISDAYALWTANEEHQQSQQRKM